MKKAWTILPTPEQGMHYLKTYGPLGLAGGAAAAGTLQLAALIKGIQRDQQEQKPDNDTLVVPIPAKTARSKEAGPLTGIVNHLGRNWGRYAGGAGAVGAGLGADALLHSKDQAAGQVESSLGDAGGILAVLAGGGLLGYHTVNNIMENRRKQQLQDRLDSAKQQYGTLLGQSLVAGKTASLDDPNDFFPIIQGMCLGVVQNEFPEQSQKIAESWPSIMLGMGVTGLPVLSAILAHKWMYNRQKELEALHTQTKPSPPKQIRLVSSEPSPMRPGENEPALLEEPKLAVSEEGGLKSEEVKPGPCPCCKKALKSCSCKKAGELPELLGALALGSAAKEEGKHDPLAPKPEAPITDVSAHRVGPGAVQIVAPSGPIDVEAQDPAAAAVLNHGGAGKITQLIKALQAQPEMAA